MVKKSLDIYQESKYFFWILRLSCLAFFKFDEVNKTLKKTFVSHSSFAISIFIWIILIFYHLKGYQLSDQYSTFLDRLWISQYMVQKILIVVVIIFSYCKTNRIEGFMRALHSFDTVLEKRDGNIRVGNYYSLLILPVSIAPVATIIIFTVLLKFHSSQLDGLKFSFAETVFLAVDYAYGTLFYVLISMQFIASSRCVVNRLDKLVKYSS